MKPFRTSLTARIVSSAVTLSLVGGGALAMTRAPTSAVAILLLASVGACIVGLLLGVRDHAGAVALLAIFLPLLLWPYVMVVEWIVTRAPRYGIGLLVAGGVVLAFTLVGMIDLREPSPAQESGDQGFFSSSSSGASRPA
jgi:hypothetical protein